MNIWMALVDYIPVALFLAATILLQREFYGHMSKGAFAILSAGSVCVFVAGLFKATWKLLYAAGVCDFQALNKCFFPMQTTGFVLAGLGVLAMVCYKQGEKKESRFSGAAAVPAVFSGTMLFVALMIAGVGLLDTCLLLVAKKRKKYAAIPLFVLSFVFVLAMGYLSAKDFSQAYMNWLAEAVNIVGQGLLLAGAILIREKKCAEAV